MTLDDYTNNVGPFATPNATVFMGNTEAISFFARGIPISGWQATDIVTPEASLVEYASTTDTWDGAGSTVYRGSDGTQIGGALTASRVKTITWSTAPKAADSIRLEFSADRIAWFDASQVAPLSLSSAGTADTSAGFTITGTTVTFNRYKTIANDDSPTADWANTLYWRLVKSPSSNLQSFFLQGPVKGGGSGNAIPAGYVGELLSNDGSSTALTTAQYSDGGCSPIVLTPGAWDVQASAFFDPASGSTVTASVLVAIGTATGNSGTGITSDAVTKVPGTTAGAAQNMSTPLKRYYVAPGATTTLYPKILGAFTVAGLNGIAYIRARRVD
jgi:hypothetical protein